MPQARVGDNFWYALMTAHGLGSFVGWGAFAVMGLSWWVLAGVGFPVRGFGLAMARITWWLMVLGVLGVIVTTVFMGFGASWVFLYPLPFYGSGNWGDWATGLFSFSVLLAGLAIVSWCFAILHTVANREARRLARESLSAGEARLVAGTGTTFEVLQLQKQLADAETAELRAIADYNKAVAQYRLQTGTTLQVHGVKVE